MRPFGVLAGHALAGHPLVQVDPAQLGEVRVFTFGDPDGEFTVAANGSARSAMRFRSDRGFLWTGLGVLATDADGLTFKVEDEGAQKTYMNQPIVASLMSSPTRERPYAFPVPLFVKANGEMIFEWADTSGAANTVQLAAWGYKLSRKGEMVLRDTGILDATPYWHRDQFTVTAGAGSVIERIITMQGGGRFLWRELNATARTNYDLQWLATSGDVAFSTGRYAVELQAGYGEYPGTLEAPYLFDPQEDITLRATNRTAGGIATTIVMGGAKVWRELQG